MTYVIGVDTGVRELPEADRQVHALADELNELALDDDVLFCTHLVRSGPFPHIAVSIALPLPDEAAARAAWLRLSAPGGAERGLALWSAREEDRPLTGWATDDRPPHDRPPHGRAPRDRPLRGPAALAGGAAVAAAEHGARTAGRAVRYPGHGALTGTLTVARLLATTAIERVTVIGAPGAPDRGTRLVTRGHVRPHWQAGRLTLATMPAAGGTLVPFEDPDPTRCCADHGVR
ncbi:hypothetical protein QWM81_22665 [Streptomyces ficellus]|uniref:Universal stress protein n=1 Tax=Streptomyces ficellus TaxID=1977088 RepID=A0ABT7ZBH5_9ACTN|nr:hypothetical protein [Streptomyces ficellus]MDN3296798.1 hypothetical protein [Streptomyces ficellus]